MVLTKEKIELDYYEKFIPIEIKEKLQKLVEKGNIGEEFNYDADFKYLGFLGDELVICVIYMLQPDQNQLMHPRFIHLILDDKVKRTKDAYKFIKFTFEDVEDKGYTDCVAIMLHNKTQMIEFAERFGFLEYASDEKCKYFIKNLN